MNTLRFETFAPIRRRHPLLSMLLPTQRERDIKEQRRVERENKLHKRRRVGR